jgi:hypothetical protein
VLVTRLRHLQLAAPDEMRGRVPHERHERPEAVVATERPRGLRRADRPALVALGKQTQDGLLGVLTARHPSGVPARLSCATPV